MGLTGTAKKLQKVMDAAEKLYSKMNEIIGELKSLQSEVETTSEQVDRMERELAEQRALLETVADRQGVDVESVLATVEYPEALTADEADDSGGDESDTAETDTADGDETGNGSGT